jgi:hypothetical protein
MCGHIHTEREREREREREIRPQALSPYENDSDKGKQMQRGAKKSTNVSAPLVLALLFAALTLFTVFKSWLEEIGLLIPTGTQKIGSMATWR